MIYLLTEPMSQIFMIKLGQPKTTEMALTCPNCRKPISPTSKNCPSCGIILKPQIKKKTEPKSPKKQEHAEIPTNFYCPACNTKVSPRANRCHKCGLPLKPQPKSIIEAYEKIKKQEVRWVNRFKTGCVVIIGIMVLLILFSVSLNHCGQEYQTKRKYDNPTIDSPLPKSSKPKLEILRFKSTNFDIEYNGVTQETINATTYHKFDYDNLELEFKYKSNGNWIYRKMKMTGTGYKDQGILASTHVIPLNDEIYKEAWFVAELDILGYDLHDGKRLSFYGIEQMK
ncbi:MAG: zinc ribbon domain-containing protein [Cyclobacteriaceae bacterium]